LHLVVGFLGLEANLRRIDDRQVAGDLREPCVFGMEATSLPLGLPGKKAPDRDEQQQEQVNYSVFHT
jgi:hypothetical protein